MVENNVSNNELVDMLLMYGEAHQNASLASICHLLQLFSTCFRLFTTSFYPKPPFIIRPVYLYELPPYLPMLRSRYIQCSFGNKT